MAPFLFQEACEVYISEDESLYSRSGHSDSDADNAPPIKHKTPLNEQYKAAARSEAAVDIDWIPSYSKYQERVSRHLKAGLAPVQLPLGFPALAKGGPSWSGADINVKDLVTRLGKKDVEEIEQALAYFKGLGVSKGDITPETFPLPALASVMKRASQDVHEGNGLSILRGLNPSKYSFEDNIIIYAGIVSYVGETRGKQDDDGNILVHIKDVGSKVASNTLRQSPYANNAQPFHNDLGDITALYCMDKAKTGGVSSLAPTATVYNDIAAYRPDLINELAAAHWAFDKNDGSQSYRTRPILFYDSSRDRAFFCFSRRQLTGSTVSPRPPYLPPLSEAQAEALDAVHFTASKHALKIQLEKGDIQISNNLALFHAREAFTDGADSQKRHLVRMWLRNEEQAWPTPPELQEVWDEIYGDQEGQTWYMSPNHERAHVINRYKSCHG